MENKVIRTIKKFNMIKKGDSIVIGLSGGADSISLAVILTHLKKEMKLKLIAVHINHGIRGEEADRDQAFVESFCKENDIELFVEYKDIINEAKIKKLSLEEAGRNARYKAFEEVMNKKNASKLALGHHKNDQAETVLHNIIRGTSLKGLGGIRPIRDNIIRPLIECTRKEIEDFCEQRGITFIEDSTNFKCDYTRNKIRNHLIPYIEENFNPLFAEKLCTMSELLQEEEDYIARAAAESLAQNANIIKGERAEIGIEAISKMHTAIRKRVLREMVFLVSEDCRDYENKHIRLIEELIGLDTGKSIALPKQLRAEINYDLLVIKKNTSPIRDWSLDVTEGKNYLDINGNRFRLDISITECKQNMYIEENTYTKWFDYDKINGGLSLRSRNNGDYIQLKGKKKIKDYMIDQKIPREKRKLVPLLTDNNGIIWILGYRISEAYKVDEKTTKILKVSYFKEEEFWRSCEL